MSTPQATVFDLFNLRIGSLHESGAGIGVGVRAQAGRVFGMARSSKVAKAGSAAATVQAVAATTHKWAERVGKYNNNPIWAEVFQNIQENRRRLKEEFNELE